MTKYIALLSIYHMPSKWKGAMPCLDELRSKGIDKHTGHHPLGFRGRRGLRTSAKEMHGRGNWSHLSGSGDPSQKQQKLTTDQRGLQGWRQRVSSLSVDMEAYVLKCVPGDGRRSKEKEHIHPTARECTHFRNNVQKAWDSRWNPRFHFHNTTQSPSQCLSSDYTSRLYSSEKRIWNLNFTLLW